MVGIIEGAVDVNYFERNKIDFDDFFFNFLEISELFGSIFLHVYSNPKIGDEKLIIHLTCKHSFLSIFYVTSFGYKRN